MPTYPSNGQFGGSPYNNPQMGWNNQSSQQNQWQGNFTPDQASWVGNAPGHQGQSYAYNPMTGEAGWNNSTEGLVFGSGNSGTGGAGTAWYIDPTTGMKTVNMNYINKVMGNVSGGANGSQNLSYQGYTPSEYEGGSVTPGAGYGGFDYDTIGSGIDPSAVIAAQEYKLNEAMQGDFAKAGGRMGQSGFAMSTPYANSLGDASRKASQDRNAITLQYQYDAAQAQAARDLQQQMQAAQLDFGGWQTGYQGDLQSQMFNQGQNFDAWMAKNNWGMQNNQGQNDFNIYNAQLQQGNQNNQQALMAAILGGMF